MNIKTFTIIAIASFAVLSVTACGGKQKASIETEYIFRSIPVHLPATYKA